MVVTVDQGCSSQVPRSDMRAASTQVKTGQEFPTDVSSGGGINSALDWTTLPSDVEVAWRKDVECRLRQRLCRSIHIASRLVA